MNLEWASVPLVVGDKIFGKITADNANSLIKISEDKLKHIERMLKEYGSVAMIGDGVNDAPAMAVATLVYGLIDHRTLFIAFSFVGLITGIGQLRYWLRTPTTHRHWWFAHMGGMLGSCIAALTALVVVNASRFGTRTFATTIWIAVPAVGIPAIFAWTAYYRRRFATRPAELP